MELTRRTFVKILIGAFAALPAGAWGVAQSSAPVRFVRAITASKFPGRLRPLDDAAVRKPAKWSG